jgi:DNA gyrase subunit A
VLASDFKNARTKGMAGIKLDEGDKLVSALLTEPGGEVVFISRRGKALRTSEDSIRAMGRTGRGVKGMKLPEDDELSACLCVKDDETMFILTEYGFGKRIGYDGFSQHGRGTGGQRVYGVSEKTGEISGAVSVREDEEVMAITSQGKSLKMKVKDIRPMGPAASGVRILSIEKPDFVIGLDKIVNEE